MLDKRTIVASLIGGIVITLISGFVPRRVLMGGTHYGWPIAWLVRLVLTPQYNPWKVLPIGLVVDIVLWGLIVFLIYYYVLDRS